MAWKVQYGQSVNNQRWYWRLHDTDSEWNACIGGGGHATKADCLAEIETARKELPGAPLQSISYT